MKRVFLSDNDGTLTVSRKPIRGEMAETIVEFANHFEFVIVTGSPYHDMEEQMPPEILYHPNVGYFCNMGNTLYREGKLVYDAKNTIDFDFFKPILYDDILKNCPYQFHTSLPRHHEIHANCSINFTMLGRPEVGEPSDALRREYAAWDEEVGQRRWIIDYMKKLYPEYNMSLGGQISVDIVKKGCDKAGAIQHFTDYEIGYFGDRIYMNGNDNSAAHEICDLGGTIYSVANPVETMRIMQSLIEQDKAGLL